MLRLIILLAVLICMQSQNLLFGQNTRPVIYEDGEAYKVYSAILSSSDAVGTPPRKSFIIRQETLRNFGALIDSEAPAPICLRPDTDSEKIIGTAIADYVRVNKTKWKLKEKFQLKIPYKLIPSEEVLSLIRLKGWDEFYRRNPNADGFIDLSAVGFNADKTVAVVSKGRWCGQFCGEGKYYVLQKKEGQWKPLKWNGEFCGWIS